MIGDELENGQVLFGVTLHDVDQERPQGGVLDIAHLSLQTLQLVGVLTLLGDKGLGRGSRLSRARPFSGPATGRRRAV